MSKLVIVESPTKIKKLQQYLPGEYRIDSCVGHIRDLPSKRAEIPKAIKDEPWADFGIDYENGFKPHYITIRGKGKVVTELRRKLKDADELLLATDEDREGESISWHLVEALKPKVPVKRMVFNEITKTAVLAAVENTRELDLNLVQAQETRRLLDRLYGYALSPLLWKKVGGNLSAGRVQSVAVRLVVMRERERRAFVTGSYWDLSAALAASDGGPFDARLVSVGGKRVAGGKDFDKDTGHIKEGLDVLLLEEETAKDLQSRLRDADWRIADVEQRERRTKAPVPFITSTLQQEANNRLNLSARQTMQIAQSLYQNGFITYMRTDSTALSEEALNASKEAILKEFGPDHYGGPRSYAGKGAKGAQEAHEAIRPAGEVFAHPNGTGLRDKDLQLYRLIWQRTLASQMVDEQATHTTVTLNALEASFTATGKRVDFPGFRAVYKASGSGDTALPPVTVGEIVACRDVDAQGHETKPPARFTEASLVKGLEEGGIGRPSTYASILDTILRRNYVIRKGKALVPTFTAFAVTGLLEKHFPRLVDPEFTASMEATLDSIAAGEAEQEPFLAEFFLGPNGLKQDVEEHMESMDPEEARRIELGDFPYPVKTGRFGAYAEVTLDGHDEVVRVSIPEDLTPDEVDKARLEQMALTKLKGPEPLGTDPDTGLPIYVLDGRFGPYFQLGETPEAGDKDAPKPKRASLPKGMHMENAELDEAIFLLSLPRQLGPHPEGGDVIAGIGRFGPYVAWQPEGDGKPIYRNLKEVDQVRSVTLPEALARIEEAPARRARGPKVIKELGDHPKGGPVRVLDGRYGPYVNHKKTNATVPKEQDASALTMEQAVELLAAKAKS